jgi:periplasmic protein TonB
MNTPIYADLDQIVFEGRSKEYGAYHMRKRYNRILSRASIIAFLLFLSVTGLPKVITWVMPKTVAPVEEMGPVVMKEYELPVKPETKPEPIPEIPHAAAPKVETVALLVPVPTPEEKVIDEKKVAEIVDLENAAIGLENSEGIDGENYPWSEIGDCIGCETPEEIVVNNDVDSIPDPGTFINLEKEPQPVNLDDLQKIIGYPAMAVEGEIEGKVIVRVLVDKRGDYVKHIVLKNPHPILTNAVSQKINQLKMTPGIQAGKPISVWVTLPFDFQLLN